MREQVFIVKNCKAPIFLFVECMHANCPSADSRLLQAKQGCWAAGDLWHLDACQVCSPTAGAQIRSRQPLFDQLTANVYEPGEGICAHVDLHKFEDGIAIVSLGSAAVMDFTFGSCHERLLLRPGDVLLLEGDARWAQKMPKYCHGLYFLVTKCMACSAFVRNDHVCDARAS